MDELKIVNENGNIENAWWNYSAGLRFNKKIDLTCDVGEDKVNSKIGTLTSDEAKLAGIGLGYLYDNSQSYDIYWTLSLEGSRSRSDRYLLPIKIELK